MYKIFCLVKKKRSDFFVESIIQLARKDSGVCWFPFFFFSIRVRWLKYDQSDIESLHHVEKVNQNSEKKPVKEAIRNIQKLRDIQDSEEVRAIYGADSYVLSAAYKQFFVPRATWHNWTVERKNNHVQKFRNY